MLTVKITFVILYVKKRKYLKAGKQLGLKICRIATYNASSCSKSIEKKKESDSFCLFANWDTMFQTLQWKTRIYWSETSKATKLARMLEHMTSNECLRARFVWPQEKKKV